MSRNEILRNAESKSFTNRRTCTCFEDGCNTIIPAGHGVGVFIPSRGKRYLCRQCANASLNQSSYHTSARLGFDTIGTPKSGGLESTHIGVEFEAVVRAENEYNLRRMLAKIGRIESDGTVDFEAPTAIMEGLKTLSKTLEYIERGGFIPCFNNERCGAHIHVECNKVPYIRRYYHSVFLPLARYIEAMGRDKRIECFGSDFRYYACMISAESIPSNHANIFNVQHEHTLEFRLPRITSKDEYMRIAKFWREIGYSINTFNFCEDNASNTVRRAEARKCGEALVLIAKKYFD